MGTTVIKALTHPPVSQRTVCSRTVSIVKSFYDPTLILPSNSPANRSFLLFFLLFLSSVLYPFLYTVSVSFVNWNTFNHGVRSNSQVQFSIVNIDITLPKRVVRMFVTKKWISPANERKRTVLLSVICVSQCSDHVPQDYFGSLCLV